MKLHEKLILIFILILAFIPRFTQLGYSHFYGDETKALYTQKGISAREYFMNQRKGPVQSLVSWAMEKVVGSYDEFYTRLPYALAGFLAVLGFFLVAKALTSTPSSLLATFLFSLSGFYIAYSRTVQYQSLLLMFGLFSVWFFYLYTEKKNNLLLLISAGLLALSVLSHYDGLFFVIPIAYFFLTHREISIKHAVAFFLVPSVFITGYFGTNTFAYLYQRALGFYLLPNSSFFTFRVYNPLYVSLIPAVFVFIPFVGKIKKQNIALFAWFIIPFVAFELLFSNPGTHIHNYMIPLYILSGLGIYRVFTLLKNKSLQTLYCVTIAIVFALIAVANYSIYIPKFNTGYPWVDSHVGPVSLARVERGKYQIFLYGFPYNRGWAQIREYIFTSVPDKPRNFSTNDNVTIAEFYMSPLLAYHARPQYYIEVFDNQLDKELKETIDDPLIYFMEKEFYVDGKLVAKLYRRLI